MITQNEINLFKILNKFPKKGSNYDWYNNPKLVAELLKFWINSNLDIPKIVKLGKLNYKTLRNFSKGLRISYHDIVFWSELEKEIIIEFNCDNFENYIKIRDFKIKNQNKRGVVYKS